MVEKLNLNKYPTKLILNKPKDLQEFENLEYDKKIKNDQYDLVFIFVFSLEEFNKYLQEVSSKQLVKNNGYLYFAYPKKNNPQYKEYIDRDSIYNEEQVDQEGYYIGTQLKFSRMVSLNEVFTVVGLKSAPKKTKKSADPPKSQCVDDYIEHVDDIKQYLSKNEDLLKIYNDLTPGYQKDWARYVYSAKREETQEKRKLEMETVLADGYKSMDLYRRNK